MSLLDYKIDQIVGVDIGGSHIATAVVADNRIVKGSYEQIKLDSGAESEVILDTWIVAIQNAIAKLTVNEKLIGVAMPGPFDYENGISLIRGMNKYDSLCGLNIKEIFADRLGIPSSNIHFFNDAKSFMLGEMIAGAAMYFRKAIGITLGTGVGSAKGINQMSNDVNRGSSPFLEGIVEEYLSTRWFIKRYAELTGGQVADVKSLCELKEADGVKNQIFTEFSENLIDFLSEFIEAETPDVVIIGGNITNAANYFLPQVKEQLAFKFPEVTIKQTELWDNAALIGASYGIPTSNYSNFLSK